MNLKTILTVSALSLSSFLIAQATPDAPPAPAPEVQPATPGVLPGLTADFREVEKAAKNIEKATRKAYQLEYLTQARPLADVTFLATARTLLEEAQTEFAAQRYFVAKEKAKAAEKLYKAAEKLYEAQAPALLAIAGERDELRRSALEAPYKAQEELYKLERELEYYGNDDNRVLELQSVAQALLARGQETNPQVPAYGYAEAAKEVAKAARHLIAAARGF